MTEVEFVVGGSFYERTPDQSFTPEDFSADDRLMIQTAEQFSRKEVLPLAERIEKQEEGLMPELIRKAGELGFCGPDSPEAFGGLGLSRNLSARMLEFLSLDGSFSVTIGVTSGISQVGLSLFGTEAQKSHYLPPLATGEQIGAYALSEPNSGTDSLSMTTRADLRGDKWILNGTKMWISNAKWASLFLVMAKVGGEKVTAFLVERDAPGVSISREEHKLGLKGSSTARLVLENAEIPAENLLHEEGKGHQVAFNALNLGRFKLASMSLGPAREAMTQAIRYVHDRKQFGRAIGEFGLIRKKVAEMTARFYAAEAMIYRTGDLIDSAFARYKSDSSLSPVEANRKAAEEFSVECSVCKVFATEVEAFVVDESLQCYGGYGFTEEFPLARIFRDARVSRIYEGTNEINRVFIADRLGRKIAGGSLDANSAGDSFISELAGKAMKLADQASSNQVLQGCISDLIVLAYAEQSARLRAARGGSAFQQAYACFLNWANIEAAAAYQLASGEPVTLPSPIACDLEELAKLTYAAGGPLEA